MFVVSRAVSRASPWLLFVGMRSRCSRAREPTPLEFANAELRVLSDVVYSAVDAAGQLPSFSPWQGPERDCTERNSVLH